MNIQEFETAVLSPLFYYTRKWRASQYSDEYFVDVFHKDAESPTGVWCVASLPLEEGVQVLTNLGLNMPRGSII